MEAEDGELLAGAPPSTKDVVLALRRVIYHCELLLHADISDGDRQALWESVVVSYYACLRSGAFTVPAEYLHAHERLERERTRHVVGGSTVIPAGLCPLDLEVGALAEPYVDPEAASALSEALIGQLT